MIAWQNGKDNEENTLVYRMVKFRGMDGWQRKVAYFCFFFDSADWRCENGIGIRFPMTLSASLAARAEVSRLMRPLFSLTNDRSPMKEAAR